MRVIASNRSPEFLDKLSKSNSSSIAVEVTNLETNTTTIYHAIKAAARALKIDKRYIENFIYLKKDKPVLGKYIFKINSDNKNTNLNKKVQKTSMKVEVTDIDTKEVITYPSIGAAAKALGYRQPSVSLYIKENRTKPFKGKYLFKLVS